MELAAAGRLDCRPAATRYDEWPARGAAADTTALLVRFRLSGSVRAITARLAPARRVVLPTDSAGRRVVCRLDGMEGQRHRRRPALVAVPRAERERVVDGERPVGRV